MLTRLQDNPDNIDDPDQVAAASAASAASVASASDGEDNHDCEGNGTGEASVEPCRWSFAYFRGSTLSNSERERLPADFVFIGTR